MQTSDDLLRMCTDAMRKGEDFPTIWQNVLRGHRLVLGLPEQKLEDGKSQLHVRLMTGQWLIFDSDSKSFALH